MVLVAPEIARYTVHGRYSDRPVANVLDIEIIQSGTPAERATAVAAHAGVLVSAWADNIPENLFYEYVAQSVSWVDLNSETGTVGETTVGPGTDFPSAGVVGGAGMPGNVAFRVNKAIVAARGQRQGRMYLAGVAEAATAAATPNIVDGAIATALNLDLAAFLTAITSTASVVPPSYAAYPVVVHTENVAPPGADPEIVFTGSSRINGLTVDTRIASQRRRLRG